MSLQVISRLPVRQFSDSVQQFSSSVSNLLDTMPTPTLNFCCFGKTRRDPEIVISEVVNNITPDEDIDEEELEAKFAELVVRTDTDTKNAPN